MSYEQMSLFGNIDTDRSGKRKTVISASRRTDIPAFFYDWLQERLAEGKVQLNNPYYRNKSYMVDLRPESVHSIVLWSKDFSNVMIDPGYLKNYNLYFQYTINHYSKILEPNVPEYKNTLSVLEGLLKKYKPTQFNLRFDPVIISRYGEVDPSPDHPEIARLKAFELLCRDIRTLGMEECRVTTSYVTLYGHVRKMMDSSDVGLIYLKEKEQISFFGEMSEIAFKHGISLYSCASPLLAQVTGIKSGHCIDGELLEQLFGGRVAGAKDKGQRAACGCIESRDIGNYAMGADGMRCKHGCSYCYVRN